ncbi:MAG: hypothetical protein FWE22_07415 [Firmicutes bacterium]|nr:hypothetical protein [Bacillota bacterium]
MLVFFVVAILILTLFVMPFYLTIKAEYDIVKNEGKVRVRLFFITVFLKKFELSSEGVANFAAGYINNFNKDTLVKKLLGAAQKARIYDLSLTLEIGKSDDAYVTALAFSFFQIIASAILTFIKSQYDPVIKKKFIPVFNENQFIVFLNGIISISIADIIYGLAKHSIKRRRKAKDDSRKKRASDRKVDGNRYRENSRIS